jgi:GNAT superfamily N-acetyltransferase
VTVWPLLRTPRMRPPITIRNAQPEELDTILTVDSDAFRRYATVGLIIDLPPKHPFFVAERARWSRSLAAGDALIAEDDARWPIGIAVLSRLDGEPYLEQLSVRLTHVGQGVGTALLSAAATWAASRGPGLWLNTYGHLPWNRPFYERRGFSLVPEPSWRPEMRAIVEEQRTSLPLPEQRVVMFRPGR